VLLSKWIGGYVALVTPFLLALLSGLALISLLPDLQWRPQHWWQLGLVVIVALLYLAALYSLGLFVSACTHLATTSITMLLFLWVLIVLVLPNTAPYIAAQLVPTPVVAVVEKEKHEVERRGEAAFQATMKKWEEANPEAEPRKGAWWAYWDVLKRDQLLALTDEQKEVGDNYQRQLSEQIRIARLISRLSPMTSFVYAAADLSGTGISDRNRFLEALVEYRKEITRFGLDKWVAFDAAEKWDNYTIEGYPRFQFHESPLRQRLSYVYADILVLAVWCLLFFMAAYLSFLRYDVT
jgi:ABC-type transport system involved in multi-copper enzyme maturation permease subunit